MKIKKPLLCGFGSRALIGKDFAYTALSKYYDAERIAFADNLKEDLAHLFCSNNLDLKEILSDPTTKEIVRPLLVAYGQVMRSFNNDIWVDKVLPKDFKPKKQLTIVTDTRFVNEVRRIKQLGGYYIEIVTDLSAVNEVESLHSPQMEGLADYKVKNNFDGKFITDILTLVESLIKKNEL